MSIKFSSRIKNVAIELHNYKYFHSPYEIANPDDRFVGRKELIGKLKALLENSRTKTGAYLVTGYRGMGKSSFVNKAIEEMSACHKPIEKTEMFLRMSFILLLATLFLYTIVLFSGGINFNLYLGLAFLIVPSLISSYILGRYYNGTYIPVPEQKKLFIFKKLFAIYDTSEENTERIYRIINEVFKVSTVIAITAVTYAVALSIIPSKTWKWAGFFFDFSSHPFSSFLYLYFLSLIVLSFWFLISNTVHNIKSIENLSTWIKKYFSSSRRITIKINLGFEELKEIDVLRLVARYLENNYYHFIKLSRRNILWKFTKVVFVLMIVTAFFQIGSIKIFHNDFRNYNLLWYFFPSQTDKSIVAWTATSKDTIPFETFIGTVKNNNMQFDHFIVDNDKQFIVEQINLELDNAKHDSLFQFELPRVNLIKKNFMTLISGFYSPSLLFKFLKDSSTFNNIFNPARPAALKRTTNDGSTSQTEKDFEARIQKYANSLALMARAKLDSLSTRIYLSDYLYWKSGSDLLKIAQVIGPITRYLDYIAYCSFYLFTKTPILYTITNKLNLNYLFLLYSLILLILIQYMSKIPFLRILTHQDIYSRIKRLNEQIEARLVIEKSSDIRASNKESFFNFSRKKIKDYPIADVREIEKDLINIFEDMDSLPRHTLRPEFIFIFDELDKVEPRDTSSYDTMHQNNRNQSFENNDVRNRQQTIIRILANLKHFLTTAKAKFIFIAGRELYDAALADVADRNFFIGSIFNEILYVESFLKDSSDNSKEITSFVEEYVCRCLIPSDYNSKSDNKYSIREYRLFLEDHLNDKTPQKNEKIEKIINELLNFIVYLTYRSNGTPKKIISYFEKFIRHISAEELEKGGQYIIAPMMNNFKEKQKMFLVFNFYDQYTFGMISYMVNPVYYSVNRFLKDYGDKLLISLSFIIDHIYKFHKVGFSKEDLESSPEIIDINKPPQVKELINMILSFLSNIQIEVINSGLYNYKFNKRFTDEINYLCKINEHESAAFNFSLDESQIIKRHYICHLNTVRERYHDYNSQNEPDFIRSVSFLHMIMGDLHFYDEEYDNAILEYLEAVQLFGDNKFASLSIENILLLIKNTLKLGLAYEKRKSYDMAYITYGKLAARIVKFSNITLDDLLLPPKAKHKDFPLPDNIIKESLSRNDQFFYKRNRIRFRLAVLEKLRLIYLPFIAKFQILEKSSSMGISLHDLDLLLEEFKFLTQRVNDNRSNIPEIEFKSKLGDILFFKNGRLPNEPAVCHAHRLNGLKNNGRLQGEVKGMAFPCSACKMYLEAFNLFNDKYLEGNSGLNIFGRVLTFLDHGNPNRKNEQLLRIMANLFSDIGNIFLSCSEDNSKLSKSFVTNMLNILDIKAKPESYRSLAENFPLFSSHKSASKIEEALILYYLAAAYYREALDYKEYGYQLSKILIVFKDYYKYNKKEIENLFILNEGGAATPKDKNNLLKNGLVKRIIRAYYRAYENSHHLELNDYFLMLDNQDPKNLNYNTTSIVWEIKEIVIVYNTMLLYYYSSKNSDEMKKIIEGKLMSRSMGTIYSMYNRSVKLEYFALQNYYLAVKLLLELKKVTLDKPFDFISFENLHSKEIIKCLKDNESYFIDKKDGSHYFLTLVMDSIFCLTELIRISKITGISYDTSHLFMANTYYQLGHWCKLYELRNKYITSRSNSGDGPKITVSSEYGINVEMLLSSKYNFEMALHHYRSAYEAHNNGMAYKDMIDDMIFLNDDYNDNFYHFCAALERYNLNKNDVDKKISIVRGLLNKDILTPDLYNVEQYLV